MNNEISPQQSSQQSELTPLQESDIKGFSDSIINNRIYTRKELCAGYLSERTKLIFWFASRFCGKKTKVKTSLGSIARITRSSKGNLSRIIKKLSHLIYQDEDKYWTPTEHVLQLVNEGTKNRSNGTKKQVSKKAFIKIPFNHDCFYDWWTEMCSKNDIKGVNVVDKKEMHNASDNMKRDNFNISNLVNRLNKSAKSTYDLYPSVMTKTIAGER